jgi:hypothetical protein
MNQTPKRIDIIRDKLIGIESWAYRARHLPKDKQDELSKAIHMLSTLINELWIIKQTSEAKGHEWGWWE